MQKRIKKKIVFSDGSPSGIMLIGEAPGRQEEEQGKPFVGAAGRLLNSALRSAGLSRKDVYITNVVFWRPPDNRKPLKHEVDICRPYVIRQIKIIRPRIICALGNTALEFFARGRKITASRGKVINVKIENLHLKVLPTFHPAAVLYNRQLQKLFESDIRKLKK